MATIKIMKELSIEEKAKAYDNALKVLHKYDGAHIMLTQDLKEEMFPELKESKYEKTKRILHSISSKMSFHLRDIFTEEEFQCFNAWSYSWLKKQGEHKPSIIKFDEPDIEEMVKEYKKVLRREILGVSYNSPYLEASSQVYRQGLIDMYNKVKG